MLSDLAPPGRGRAAARELLSRMSRAVIDLCDSSPGSTCSAVDLTGADQESEALARYLSRLCEQCEAAPANEGFAWCQSCYQQRQRSPPPQACALCFATPANPGFQWCEGCYQQRHGGGRGYGGPGYGRPGYSGPGYGGRGYGGPGYDASGGPPSCSLCAAAPANPGYHWCTGCYLQQSHAGQSGNGGQGGSAGQGSSAAPPENASYEELLAWEETRCAGAPPKGMTRGQLATLPRRTFLGARDGGDAECAICQIEYEEGDDLCILPACAHTFHFACVGRWLGEKTSCPVCMRDVRQDLRS